MLRQLPKRQRVRKALVILAFLSFPITMNFLSPYVIIDGAMNGIVNGSLIMFGLMFLSSLFLGRAWCGWVCPGGGMQEMVEPVNLRQVNGRKLDRIKWIVWIPWISLIIWMVVQAGGYTRVDFLYHTQSGISVAGTPDRPIFIAYIIYYVVIALFIGLAIFAGRRAGCHTICWMAPFMMIGRWIRNRFGWASLQLTADASACSNCKLCTKNCPMSLDVNAMVQVEQMENAECILCGTCVDNCHRGAIKFSFGPSK
ncbi:MAG: 4Fe-4S binding protein [Ardenticatenaceae bacterium]|nr:4Fe-4S binding protein [Anaerolineales bacterium]MCB8923785.1 4Fe-4S binding protein [Ardenticatenaceae bacterium]MCB8990120.1 4Fe-4S binding protein [Ardenticatenaceae bacterium]